MNKRFWNETEGEVERWVVDKGKEREKRPYLEWLAQFATVVPAFSASFSLNPKSCAPSSDGQQSASRRIAC